MEQAKKENKWMLYVAVFIFLVSLTAFILALNIDSLISLQKMEIPVNVRISNYSAINVSKNQSDLNLGTASKGYGAGPRNLSISNEYPFKTIFEFEIKGNITPLMIYQPVIILEPYENRGVSFRTKIIENESLGDYSGILTIKVKKWVE